MRCVRAACACILDINHVKLKVGMSNASHTRPTLLAAASAAASPNACCNLTPAQTLALACACNHWHQSEQALPLESTQRTSADTCLASQPTRQPFRHPYPINAKSRSTSAWSTWTLLTKQCSPFCLGRVLQRNHGWHGLRTTKAEGRRSRHEHAGQVQTQAVPGRQRQRCPWPLLLKQWQGLRRLWLPAVLLPLAPPRKGGLGRPGRVSRGWRVWGLRLWRQWQGECEW